MQITITADVGYSAIPPRCRKARRVQDTITSTVDVLEISSEQAPIAFIVDEGLGDPQVYRIFDQSLYMRYLPWSRQSEDSVAGSQYFPSNTRWSGYLNVEPVLADFETTKIQAHQLAGERLERHYASFLIIDGVVWTVADEPRYVVQTFGMGHNHGGTGLMVSTHLNSNIRPESYFPADQFAIAQMSAMEVAARRGDTESVTRIQQMSPPITVLMPEAVHFSSAPQQSSFLAEGHEVGTRIPEHGPLLKSDLPQEQAWQNVRNESLRARPTDWLRWDAAVHAVKTDKVDTAYIERFSAHLGTDHPIVHYLEDHRG